MPTSSKRLAANRLNAQKATGPRTEEGKARASQNARKRPFNPDPFTIIRIEDRTRVAALVAGAIATYQPINSQERLAVERIAIAQHSMYRLAAIEAGLFTNCLNIAMLSPEDPKILERSQLCQNIPPAIDQNRAFWLAFGFDQVNRQSKIVPTFLRFQAQAERLYRRAVDDFHRLQRLRGQLPPENDAPNEPVVEPPRFPQCIQKTTTSDSGQLPSPTENEPKTNPSSDADPQ
jgi:hypothetical protein